MGRFFPGFPLQEALLIMQVAGAPNPSPPAPAQNGKFPGQCGVGGSGGGCAWSQKGLGLAGLLRSPHAHSSTEIEACCEPTEEKPEIAQRPM